MDLEFITLSEVRQTRKVNIVSFICGIYKKKNDTDTLIYQKEINYGFQRGKVRG